MFSARLLGVITVLGAASAAWLTVPQGPPPAWLEGAVVYGVVPTLFGRQPLKAVEAKLDSLRELGVDAIWLSPIFETSDESAISYEVTDYFKVRPDFGTAEEMKRLVSAAKQRGMRMIIDFVPNHVSRQHPFFADVEKHGRESRYHDYFVWGKDGEATFYFDWKTLLNLNYGNPEVRALMIDAFTYWVREFDVDGFRIDAAWGIRERNPEFWHELVTALRREKPDVFLLAEASAQDPFYVRTGFTAAYDWSKELGVWAWKSVFADPTRAGTRLRAAMRSSPTAPERVARFLNNNDTGQRFITQHGLPMTRLAATLLHTLPGIPIVYTGDEIGAEFEPYADPPPLRWTDPHRLRAHYKQLATLREEVPALRRGDFEILDTAASAFAFVRRVDGEPPVLVVANFAEAMEVPVPLGRHRRDFDAPLRDLLTGEVVAVRSAGSRLHVAMAASTAVVLTLPR
jgi:cyclomaltodextrinase / maltogenic alpha-amylase / neopullulanase